MADVGSVDAVVIGSTVTALTLACDLQRRGVDFVLVEHSSASSAAHMGARESQLLADSGDAEGYGDVILQPRSLEMFEDLDVSSEIMRRGRVQTGERVYLYGDLCVDWLYDSSVIKQSSIFSLPVTLEQRDLKSILRERLDSSRIIADDFVCDITVANDGSNEILVTLLNEGHSIRCKYCVGADGFDSFVRESVKFKSTATRMSAGSFITADVNLHWSLNIDDAKYNMLLGDGVAMCAVGLEKGVTSEEGSRWHLTVHRPVDKARQAQAPVQLLLPPTDDSASTTTAPPTDCPVATNSRSISEDISSPASSNQRWYLHAPPLRSPSISTQGTALTAFLSPQPPKRSDVGDKDEKGEAIEEGELVLPTREELEFMIQKAVPSSRLVRINSISRSEIVSRSVTSFRRGNVLVAGGAAVMHPPLLHQGLNDAIQDAYNLGWKLALVVKGSAPDALLDTYDQERRAVGGHARLITTTPCRSIASGSKWVRWAIKAFCPTLIGFSSVNEALTCKAAQINISYPANTAVCGRVWMSGSLRPGQRAPDAMLAKMDDGTNMSFVRLHQLLSGPHHTLLVCVRLPFDPTAAHTGPQRILSPRSVESSGELPPSLTSVIDAGVLASMLEEATTFACHAIRPFNSITYGTHVPIRAVFVLTAGKASIIPVLPLLSQRFASLPPPTQYPPAATAAQVGELPAFGESWCEGGGGGVHDAASSNADCVAFLTELMARKLDRAVEDNELFVGWDAEGEVVNRFKLSLQEDPSPSPWSKLMDPIRMLHNPASECGQVPLRKPQHNSPPPAATTTGVRAEASIDYTGIYAGGVRVGTGRCGAFALIRPDGYLSNHGYLGDSGARDELLGRLSAWGGAEKEQGLQK
ncbi:unnamed protein product [Vitrella brassicaformis CCMP3155]|uniref:FAD-binding domain-containing protein n=2 Tax=Vitrella brassicaformis TaxID=1169539 RepID=A0A0G4FJN6_VITBC|nr:unnamed protein product [Vitrella brassicaformis CCMP3155]|eukprot:CEM13969.1 unnamed protein product [Vitrella brassicaformis CCMP3155]